MDQKCSHLKIHRHPSIFLEENSLLNVDQIIPFYPSFPVDSYYE